MASTHIEVVATASRLGADMRALIDAAGRLHDDAIAAKEVTDEVVTGNDYPALALKWGCSEADAETVYDLLKEFVKVFSTADY